MDTLWFIGFVAAFISIASLRSRIATLECEVRARAVQPTAAPVPQASAVPANPLAAATAIQMPSAQAAPTEPDSSDRFIAWLAEDWMLKLGVVLLLIGLGWLTTYAFWNNWIGPAGRILLGLTTGVVVMLFGWYRMRSYVHQGGVFMVLGSTTVLLTIYAAREYYGYFTPAAALVVMFLSSAFVAMASVQYKRPPLALSSLIIAGIAPLLTNSPSADYIGLFLYLLVVVIGSIWVVVLSGTRELTTAGLMLVAFYSVPHLLGGAGIDPMQLLPFAFGFAALFFLTNTIGIVRAQESPINADITTAAGNGIFLLAWILAAAPTEIQSLLIAAWMIVFAIGAFAIFSYTGRREPFYVYACVSIAMLAAATAAELHGAALTIALTFEAAIIPILARILTNDTTSATRLSWIFVAPTLLSLGSLTSYAWTRGVVHEDFFVLLILALMFFFTGMYLLPYNRAGGDDASKQTNYLLLVMGSLYAFALVWLSLKAALAEDNTAIMLSLAVYTIVGLATYFYGMAANTRGLLHYGGIVIGFVVVRLLIVDVWRMPLAGRIVTFFVIGTLLVTSAFLGKSKKQEPPIVVS